MAMVLVSARQMDAFPVKTASLQEESITMSKSDLCGREICK